MGVSFVSILVLVVVFGVYWYVGFEERVNGTELVMRRVPVTNLIWRYRGFTKGFVYGGEWGEERRLVRRVVITVEESEVKGQVGRLVDEAGNTLVSSQVEFGSNNVLRIRMLISPKWRESQDPERDLNAGLHSALYQLTQDDKDQEMFAQVYKNTWVTLQQAGWLYYPLIKIKS